MSADTFLSNIIQRRLLCFSTVSDEFLVAVDSYFLVSWQAKLFALLSWELHFLDSTSVMFAGQAALLSVTAWRAQGIL